jgi:hypothetical protein
MLKPLIVFLTAMLMANNNYINLMEMKKVCFDGSGKPSKENARISMRIATSGGNAPHEVMMAVANLYKAMQQHGLNEHPLND